MEFRESDKSNYGDCMALTMVHIPWKAVLK